jgi:hypothetical protein
MGRRSSAGPPVLSLLPIEVSDAAADLLRPAPMPWPLCFSAVRCSAPSTRRGTRTRPGDRGGSLPRTACIDIRRNAMADAAGRLGRTEGEVAPPRFRRTLVCGGDTLRQQGVRDSAKKETFQHLRTAGRVGCCNMAAIRANETMQEQRFRIHGIERTGQRCRPSPRGGMGGEALACFRVFCLDHR